jgi:hypothetical protein
MPILSRSIKHFDLIHYLRNSLDVSHGSLRQLLVEEARQTASQDKHPLVEHAEDFPNRRILAGPKTGFGQGCDSM